jgi:hypothetical protein
VNLSISQKAAIQTSWNRWVEQALAVAAPRPRKLALIQGEDDDMTAPGPAHPASKAMKRKEKP